MHQRCGGRLAIRPGFSLASSLPACQRVPKARRRPAAHPGVPTTLPGVAGSLSCSAGIASQSLKGEPMKSVSMPRANGSIPGACPQGAAASLSNRVELTSRALIRNERGSILLVRSKASADCLWQMPGRQIRRGESCAMSIVRCLHDDLGILTWPVSAVFINDQFDSVAGHHILSITYAVSVISGEPRVTASGQLDEGRWFPASQPPEGVAEETISALKSRELVMFSAS
jgi:ADP-ribose pyrophosphatase YjhB (NUDIX family)